MSSDAHLRKDHGTPSPSSPYIDWGPDLPSHYAGGRARLLVANPHALYLVWESDLPSPGAWRLELTVQGALLEALDLPGGIMDAWLTAPAGTRGEVALFRDGAKIATLPFTTPPAGPSEPAPEEAERWGRLVEGLMIDASRVAGYSLDEVSGPASVGSGFAGAR